MLADGRVSDYRGYLPVTNADDLLAKVLLADKAMIETSFEAAYSCLSSIHTVRIPLPSNISTADRRLRLVD
jgi:hypothetical protein